MTKTVERTALSAFTLNGLPVRKGQVVTVDEVQFEKLVAAGCIHADASKNKLVTVTDLPATQAETVNAAVDVEQARVAEARQVADAEIAAIDKVKEDRRAEIAAEVAKLNEDHKLALDTATKAHSDEIAEINKRVAEAKTQAEAEIAEIAKSVDEAKEKAVSKKNS